MVAIVSGNSAGLLNSSAAVLGQQGMIGKAVAGNSQEAAYVNIATGNVTLQDSDAYVASRGSGVDLARTYNSRGTFNDGLGGGWRLSLLRQVTGLTGTVNTSGSEVKRIDGDGSVSSYVFDSTRNAYVTSDGAGAYQTMTYDATSAQWTWRADRQDLMGRYEVYDANQAGKIIRTADKTGTLLSFEYVGDILSKVTDSSSDVTRFDFVDGNLKTITTSTSLGKVLSIIQYDYDASNRLKTVTLDVTPPMINGVASTPRSYVTTYTYDGASTRIAQVTQSDGTRLKFEYVEVSAGNWKVAKSYDAFDRVTRFDYSAAEKTVVTDPLGRDTEYGYDAQGNLSTITAPAIVAGGARQITRFDYDASGNVKSIVDPLNNTSLFYYDANGNRVDEQLAGGVKITRVYDLVTNRLLNETRYLATVNPDDPTSGQPLTSRNVYDTQGRLHFAVSAAGRVTQYLYDEKHQRSAQLVYNDNLYDVSGLAPLDKISDATLTAWANGATVDRTKVSREDYTYDSRGLVATTVRYATTDNLAKGVGAGLKLIHVYDEAGRLLSTTEVGGANPKTEYVYDPMGRLVATTDAMSGNVTTPNLKSTSIMYDDANGRTITTAVNGLRTVSTYDGNGDLLHTSQTNTMEVVLAKSANFYDAAGQLRRIDQGTAVITSIHLLYDNAGRKVGEIDQSGYLTEYFYNDKNLLLKSTRYAVKVDAVKLASLRDAGGAPVDVPVDTLRAGASSRDNRSTWNSFDAAGRLIKTVVSNDASGKAVGNAGIVTAFDYDGSSRLVKVTQFDTLIDLAAIGTSALSLGVIALPVGVAADRVTRTFYDKDNNVIGRLDAEGYVSETRYNGAGQKVYERAYAAETAAAIRATGTLSALIASAVPSPGQQDDIRTRYFYNGQNQLVAMLDPENYLTQYYYGADGTLALQTRLIKKVITPSGALLETVGYEGLVWSNYAGDRSTIFDYSPLGQLLSESTNNGTSTHYTYDRMGNVLEKRDAKLTIDDRANSFTYDLQGRLTAELSGEGTALLELAKARNASAAEIAAIWTSHGTSYTVDEKGLRTSATDANGHRTLYYYDAIGQLRDTINAAGEVHRQTYNAFGQVERIIQFATRLSTAELSSLTGGQVALGGSSPVPVLAETDARITNIRYNATGQEIDRWEGALDQALDLVNGIGSHTKRDYNAFGDLVLSAQQGNDGVTYIKKNYEYDHRGNLVKTYPLGLGQAQVGLATQTRYDAFSRAFKQLDLNSAERSIWYDRLGNVRATAEPNKPVAYMSWDAFGRKTADIDPLASGQATFVYSGRAMTAKTVEGIVHKSELSRLGQKVTITDGNNNVTHYAYNKDGALLSVTDAAGRIQKNTFDNAGLLATSTDANNVVTTYSYDKANRVLSKVVDPSGGLTPGLAITTTYTYDAIGRVATFTDARGIVTENTYDLKGQLKTIKLGGVLQATYAYDTRGNQTKLTDANGVVTEYLFDDLGNPRGSIVDAGGVNKNIRLVYDSIGPNLLLRAEGPNGEQATRYVYNANNQKIWEVDPEGRVTGYTYDGNLRLESSTRYANASSLVSTKPVTEIFSNAEVVGSFAADAARDVTNRFAYDRDGRLSATIDGNGTVTAFVKRDGEGRVIEQVTYARPASASISIADLTAAIVGGTLSDPSRDVRQRNVYDVRGRVTISQQALGQSGGLQTWSVRTYDYDANGNVIAQTAFAKPFEETRDPPANIATWIEDSANRSASDSVARMVYDKSNRMIAKATAQRDAGNGLRAWTIQSQMVDANGNVLEQRAHATALIAADADEALILGFVGDIANRSANDAVSRFAYDGLNRITDSAVLQGTTDGRLSWAMVRQQFDAMGNVVARTAYAKPLIESVPMAPFDGMPVWFSGVIADPGRDRVDYFGYDKANRLTVSVDAVGAVARMQYDALGNLVQRTEYAKPVSLTGPPAASYVPPVDIANDRVTRTVYDRDSRPALVIDARGAVTRYEYDALGNTWATRRYANTIDTSALGVAPTLSEVTALLVQDASRDRVERAVHDKDGRVSYTVDARGFIIGYEYDAIGNLKVTKGYQDPRGIADGNLAANVAAALLGQPAGTRGDTLDYDAQGRIVSSTDALGKTERFGYDALGRKLTFTNKRDAVWDYTYDNAGHLLTETSPSVEVMSGRAELPAPGAKWNFYFDAEPNHSMKRLRTELTYDSLGNVKSRTEAAGLSNARTTQYFYDAAGRQIKTIFPNVARYVPETQANLFSNANEAARSEAVAAETSTTTAYDVFGNAISSIDVGGKASYKTYDRQGKVLNEIDAAGYATGYVHNAFGEVVSLTRLAKEPVLPANDSASINIAVAAANSARDRTITTQYDRSGNVAKVIEPTSFVFDQAALNGVTQFNSARTTRSTYNAFGEVYLTEVYGADAAGTALTQARETYSYFDMTGNRLASINVVRIEGAMRYGYLSTHSYDAAGNMTSVKEYARELQLGADALKGWSHGLPTADSSNDRSTTFEFNLLNQKFKESRLQVTFHQGGTNLPRTAVTQYGFDAVGNATSVTDALGDTAYTYFDSLGRISAVASSHADGTPAPLTVFRRDAYGNVIQRMDHGNGASSADATGYTIASAGTGISRGTYSLYDLAGRQLFNLDAERNASFASYDVYGHAVKQWQRVANYANESQISFQLMRYDALGRLTEVQAPDERDSTNVTFVDSRGMSAKPSTVSSKITEYNGFGEIVSRAVNYNGVKTSYAYAEYDNAGRQWHSNDGDGVNKVLLFDAIGNMTSRIVSTSAQETAVLGQGKINSANEVFVKPLLQRIDTRYDLMGRVIDVSPPRNAATDATLYMLQRDDHGYWVKIPVSSATPQGDSLLVVGDQSDAGTTIKVRHRLMGTGTWIEEVKRVRSEGDYIVFSTSGLATGSYEYSVQVQKGATAPVERETGAIQVTQSASTLKAQRISQLYAIILNRMPDFEGLDYWITQTNANLDLADVAEYLLTSDEGQSRLGNDSTEVFRTIFFDAFGRKAETDPSCADEIRRWIASYDRIMPTGNNHAQTIADLVSDTMAYTGSEAGRVQARTWMSNRVTATMAYVVGKQGIDETFAAQMFKLAATDLAGAMAQISTVVGGSPLRSQIAQMYVALFGHAPTAERMTYWLGALTTASMDELLTGLFETEEAKGLSLYQPTSGLTHEMYSQHLVTQVFWNMLGRSPTGAESAAWVAKLATGPAMISNRQFMMAVAGDVLGYSGSDAARIADRNRFNQRVTLALSSVALGRNDSNAVALAVMAASTQGLSAQELIDSAVAKLNAGVLSADSVGNAAKLAAATTPFEAARLRLAKLYVLLLDRAADRPGYTFQFDRLQPTGSFTFADVAAGMLTGPEAQGSGLPGSAATNADFVERVYLKAFGKVPTSAGAQAEMLDFTSKLNGGSTRGSVLALMVDGMLGFSGLTTEELALKSKFDNKSVVSLAYATEFKATSAADGRTALTLVTDTNIQAALDYGLGITRSQFGASMTATNNLTTLVKSWAQRGLDAATTSIAAALAKSAAATAAATQPDTAKRLLIAQMYVAILGRTEANYRPNADIAGHEYWISNGNGIENIALSLAGHSEFISRFGSLNNTQFVARIYENLLGNSAIAAASHSKWITMLGGGSNRGTVAAGIIDEVLKFAPGPTPDATARQYVSARSAFDLRVQNCLQAMVDYAASSESTLLGTYNDKNSAYNALNPGSLPGLLATKNQTETGRVNAVNAIAPALQTASSAGDRSATLRLMIYRLYATVLGRTSTPTLAEINFHLASSTDANNIAASILRSSEATGRFSELSDSSTTANFVTGMYKAILGRVPDAGDYTASWITVVNTYGRGYAAVKMLKDYSENFTDNKLDMLLRKQVIDLRVDGFIASHETAANSELTAATQAKTIANGQLTTASNRLASAPSERQALVNAIEPKRVAAATAIDLQTYAAQQRLITQAYMAIRGSAGVAEVVHWMKIVAPLSEANRKLQVEGVLETLTNESPQANGRTFPTDRRQLITKLYEYILGRKPSTAESDHWFSTVSVLQDPQVKMYLVKQFFWSEEASMTSKYLYTTTTNKMAAHILEVKPKLDAYNAAVAAVASFDTAHANDSGNVTFLQGEVTRLAGIVTAKSNALASASALKLASPKVSLADQAYINAVRAKTSHDTLEAQVAVARQALDTATTNWNNAKLSTSRQRVALQGADALTKMDQAIVLVAASTLTAEAFTPDALHMAQITRTYVALLGHGPTASELRYWMNYKLHSVEGDKTTLVQMVDMIMNGKEARSLNLYPASLTDSAFVDRLYSNSLNRVADNAGKTEVLKTIVPGPLGRANAVFTWFNAIHLSANTDTKTFNAKVISALQSLSTEIIAGGSNPDITGTLSVVDYYISDAALKADAAAQAAANAAGVAAANAQKVARLFVAVLRRAPDAQSLNTWVGKLGNGTATTGSLADALISSVPEGSMAFPAGMSATAFVTQIFQLGIGRTPTAAELSKFTTMLGSASRGAVASSIVDGVLAPVDGDLLGQTTRFKFINKAQAALADAAKNDETLEAVLREAVIAANAISASRPLYVPTASRALVQGRDSLVSGGNKLRASLNSITVDRWGNVLSVTDPRDPAWKTTYTYNANNQLTSVSKPHETDANRAVTSWAVTTTEYDVAGRVVLSKDANGNVNRTEYDANGNVWKEIHADGGVVTSSYNLFGNRLYVIQPATAASPTGLRTDYAYDLLGHLVETKTHAKTEIYTVTDAGPINLTITLTEDYLKERFYYNEKGQRIISFDANGAKSELRYDLQGNLVETRDARGKQVFSAFDAFGNRISQRDAKGNVMGWEVDSFGRAKTHTDMSGGVVTYRYDQAGQMVGKTSSFGQNIAYTYVAGNLEVIDDIAMKQKTFYTYDLAGRRLTERIDFDNGTLKPTRTQHNTLTYDAQGRLATVQDDQYKLEYKYDKNGNRVEVAQTYNVRKTIGTDERYSGDYRQWEEYTATQVVAETFRYYNTFDSMNRQLIVNGDLDNGNVVYGANGHALTYDKMGNRTSDTWMGVYIDNVGGIYTFAGGQPTQEQYTYDEVGRLKTTTRDKLLLDYRRYDAAGRVTRSGFAFTMGWNTGLEHMKGAIGIDGTIVTNAYDDLGRITRNNSVWLDGALNADTYYGKYDEMNNLIEYTVSPRVGDETVYNLSYEAFDTYRESSNYISSSGDFTNSYYDYNRNRKSVVASAGRTTNFFYDATGHVVQSTGGSNEQLALIVNDEFLGYEDMNAKHVMGSTYVPATSAAATAAPSVYNAQGGETLESVAKAVWGDSKLWYLIADANSITPGATLAAGQVVRIPARVNTVHNAYDTFKPYDVNSAIGDTTPVPGQDKGCGTIGLIIVIIVAVVVTVITYGAMTGPAATAVTAAGGAATATTGAAAATALTTTQLMVAGAVSAAAGSVASQLVGMAIGVQDKFSWRSVAMAGIGGAVGGAFGSMNVFGETNVFANAVVRGAVSNAVTQGIGVATGAQKSFDWRGVAAAGLASGVSASLGKAVEAAGGGAINSFANKFVTGVGSGVAAAVVRGGKFQFKNIAADAFGNALGSSIADSYASEPTAAERRMMDADGPSRARNVPAPFDIEPMTAEQLGDPSDIDVMEFALDASSSSRSKAAATASLGSADSGREAYRERLDPGALTLDGETQLQTTVGRENGVRTESGMVYTNVGQRPSWFNRNVVYPLQDFFKPGPISPDQTAYAVAQINADIKEYNDRMAAENSETGGGWADSRQPDHIPLTSTRQQVANAKYVVDNLLSKDGWSAVAAVTADAFNHVGSTNGMGRNGKYWTGPATTEKQRDNALNTALAVPGFFQKELELVGTVWVPGANRAVNVAAGSMRPMPRIDVSDKFVKVNRADGGFDFDYLDPTTHGLQASINRNGVLSFDVRANPNLSPTLGSGKDMGASLMNRLAAEGIEVRQFDALWMKGSKNVSSNYSFYNKMQHSMSPLDAARGTWTGKFLADYGFDIVKPPTIVNMPNKAYTASFVKVKP